MATTGTAASGSDFIGVNEAMKQVYAESFVKDIDGEQEVTDVFTEAGDFTTTDGPDGKQINLEHYISSGGGISFMGESDYFPTNVAPTFKQSSITIKQLGARVDLSGRTMRRVRQGPAAFASWADMALPERAKRVAFHRDRALLGTGTGIIGRISGTPDGTGDQITSAFGISGLEGAINLFEVGDNLRYSANAAGSSLRTGNLICTAIDYTANPTSAAAFGAFNTALNTAPGTPATATSAAASDYVALGDGNVTSFGSVETMGLEGIIDDGTNLSSFQGLTRSSYPSILNAQSVDASTQSSGVLTEDLVDLLWTQCWERARGKPSVLLANRSGQRSFWKALKADRVINDPQGQYKGGKKRNGLSLMLGDDEVIVKAARKVPLSRAYLIDPTTIQRFRIGAGRWDDTTGSIWRQVTDASGAKDAYFALYVEEMEYACLMPARNGKITNLVSA